MENKPRIRSLGNFLRIVLILTALLQGVVAPGGKETDPINTCKAQTDPPQYYTKWGKQFNNDKPQCAKTCLENLSWNKGVEKSLYWSGCYHSTSCDNYCRCTVDSDTIIYGYQTYVNGMDNLKRDTQGLKSWWAERYEGTMYLAYDCTEGQRDWVSDGNRVSGGVKSPGRRKQNKRKKNLKKPLKSRG